MTFASDPATVLPSLALLSHRVRVLPMDAASLVKMPENTILFLDARDDLATAKTLCRLIHASGLSTPIVLVLTEERLRRGQLPVGHCGCGGRHRFPGRSRGPIPRLVSERGNAPAAAASRFSRRIHHHGGRWPDSLRRPHCGHQRLYRLPAWTPQSIWHTRSSNSSSTWSSTPAACSRAPSCCRKYGATTTTVALVRSTCISVVCAPSSAANTGTPHHRHRAQRGLPIRPAGDG